MLTKSKREYDLATMRELLIEANSGDGEVNVFLEESNAHACKGTSQAYSMARGAAVWEGLLAGLQIPYQVVRPRVWLRALGFPAKASKGAHILMAKQLFPGVSLRLPSGKKDNDNFADALLIAEYGRRLLNGNR